MLLRADFQVQFRSLQDIPKLSIFKLPWSENVTMNAVCVFCDTLAACPRFIPYLPLVWAEDGLQQTPVCWSRNYNGWMDECVDREMERSKSCHHWEGTSPKFESRNHPLKQFTLSIWLDILLLQDNISLINME